MIKKTLTLLIITVLFCTSCGKKNDPEYKSFNYHNYITNII